MTITIQRTPKLIRMEAGLDQYELADRAEVARQTISNIERGAVKNVRALTLLRLGQALQDRFEEINEKFDRKEYIRAVYASCCMS